MAICQCGCGEEIPHSWLHGVRYEPKYKKGHSTRAPETRAKLSEIARANARIPRETLPWPRVDICQCGCGEPIPTRPYHRYKKPQYIQMHFLRMANSERQEHSRATKRAKRVQPPPGWTPPSGFCECGCGEKTSLVKAMSRPWDDAYLGYHRRFRKGHHARMLVNTRTHRWQKDHVAMKSGYIRVHRPDHPSANKDGWVLEHRLIYEESRGVILPPSIAIHHINGIKSDNRPENLIAMTRVEHKQAHRLANEIISLFLDDKLLEAAKAYVRMHGTLPNLEELTTAAYQS